MIVCTDCGRHNEDGDDFCGECGAFLEFSGERTPDAEPVVPADDELVEEPARPGLVERVKTAVLGEGAESDGEVEAGTNAASDGAEFASPNPGAEAGASDVDGTTAVRRQAQEEAQRRSDKAAREAVAARRAAEQAEREAEAERRRAAEAEERRAREAVEAAKAAAKVQAQAEAEEATRVAAARAAAAEREHAEARAEEAAAQEAVRGREEAERAAQAARERADAERTARESAEREAAARAEAERRAQEEAEAARRAAETRAKSAEEARQEAERRAEEAERAARMAALVAKPRPTDPTPAPPPEVPRPTPASKGKVEVGAAAEAGARPVDEAEQPPALTSRKPEAVKPQKQRQKRTSTPAVPAEVINPGDLICGSCGAGNDPDRRFCRRCGASLVEAAVMPSPPWYRRILRRRPKAQVAAGTRPAAKQRRRGLKGRAQYAVSGTRSRIGKVGRVLAILGLLGITGLSLGPLRSQAGDLFDRVRRIVSPEYEPVRPAEARASSELPEHPAMFAIDQIKNSYWAEGGEGDGVGEGLTLVFSEPTDIDRIGFLNGASETPADFVTQPRVREVQLLFDDGTTRRLTLADQAEFQQFGVEARDVSTVQLQILSVYPSLEGSAASLAEVELFRKS